MANGKRKKYSADEKRAYWAGVGFQARDKGLFSSQVQYVMSDKCKESFVNGREKADNCGSKFIPDLFTRKIRGLSYEFLQ